MISRDIDYFNRKYIVHCGTTGQGTIDYRSQMTGGCDSCGNERMIGAGTGSKVFMSGESDSDYESDSSEEKTGGAILGFQAGTVMGGPKVRNEISARRLISSFSSLGAPIALNNEALANPLGRAQDAPPGASAPPAGAPPAGAPPAPVGMGGAILGPVKRFDRRYAYENPEFYTQPVANRFGQKVSFSSLGRPNQPMTGVMYRAGKNAYVRDNGDGNSLSSEEGYTGAGYETDSVDSSDSDDPYKRGLNRREYNEQSEAVSRGREKIDGGYCGAGDDSEEEVVEDDGENKMEVEDDEGNKMEEPKGGARGARPGARGARGSQRGARAQNAASKNASKRAETKQANAAKVSKAKEASTARKEVKTKERRAQQGKQKESKSKEANEAKQKESKARQEKQGKENAEAKAKSAKAKEERSAKSNTAKQNRSAKTNQAKSQRQSNTKSKQEQQKQQSKQQNESKVKDAKAKAQKEVEAKAQKQPKESKQPPKDTKAPKAPDAKAPKTTAPPSNGPTWLTTANKMLDLGKAVLDTINGFKMYSEDPAGDFMNMYEDELCSDLPTGATIEQIIKCLQDQDYDDDEIQKLLSLSQGALGEAPGKEVSQSLKTKLTERANGNKDKNTACMDAMNEVGDSREQVTAEQMPVRKQVSYFGSGFHETVNATSGVQRFPKVSAQMNSRIGFGGPAPVNKVKAKGKPNKRAEVVKKIMKEKGMSMIEASKFVKANGLY